MSSLFHKWFFSAAIFVMAASTLSAQDYGLRTVKMDSIMYKLSRMTAEDYANIELPPLEELYTNASLYSNAAKYFYYESEYYRSDVRTARRKPLEWIRLIGTYSYGNIDMAAITLMETTYQVWSQNQSTQRNQYYNVGVTLSVPLMDIFNRRNLIKQAQSKVDQTKYRRESELDEIKKNIIDLYCTIIEKIVVLQSSYEQVILARGNYNFAENGFVNNMNDSESLYRSQSYETTAVRDYEEVKKDLNSAILTLEVISCTPIISDFDLISDYKPYRKQKNTNR